MYGTVALFQAKPGTQAQLDAYNRDVGSIAIPGIVATYIYQLDADPNRYYLAVIFESKEAYLANAADPMQDERYRRLRALLAADPEWHDGEVVFAHSFSQMAK